MAEYFAHSSPLGTPPPDGWQLLRDHLAGVASLAKRLAERTGVPGLPAAAEAAGWLHDVGKYRPEFQDFIRGLPPRGSKQHKEAGAAWAAKAGDQSIAFALLGHHHGMPDKDNAAKAIKGPDGLQVMEIVTAIAATDCSALSELSLCSRGEAIETHRFPREGRGVGESPVGQSMVLQSPLES